MNDKTRFNIEIAGVAAAIECTHEHNRDFLHDYITDKTPELFISPSEEDLQSIFSEFQKSDEFQENPGFSYNNYFIENNAIHALLAESLVDFNVLLMHGSAIVMDNEAYIFTAPSGTGKSTHTRLWLRNFGDRAYIINDDKPMLKVSDENILVYGTPWDGKHHISRNTSAPLKAIIQLTRDEENHIEPLMPKDAFPLLLRQCYRTKDALRMTKVLQMEQRILETVKCYKLGCNMDPSAAIVAYEGMK